MMSIIERKNAKIKRIKRELSEWREESERLKLKEHTHYLSKSPDGIEDYEQWALKRNLVPAELKGHLDSVVFRFLLMVVLHVYGIADSFLAYTTIS